MASSIVQNVSGIAPGGAQNNISVTVPAFVSGNFAIVLFSLSVVGTPTCTMTGGTPTALINDTGNGIFIYKIEGVTNGTTSFTVGNTATNTRITYQYYEVSGLKPTGNTYVSAGGGGASQTNWSTNAITNTAIAIGLVFARQQTDNTTTSTITAPLTKGGDVANGNAGESIVTGYGDFSANANPSGAGVWSVARNNLNYMVGLELSAGGGGGTTSQNAKLGMKLSMGF